MNGKDMDTLIREDARLIMLKAISEQVDERLHSGYLAEELLRFGIDRPRDWVHSELDWMAEIGAVKLTKPGSVVVAMLTEKGARHLRRAIVIEGIKRPSRPGE
jgi:repressor of nif and glnA expression